MQPLTAVTLSNSMGSDSDAIFGETRKTDVDTNAQQATLDNADKENATLTDQSLRRRLAVADGESGIEA